MDKQKLSPTRELNTIKLTKGQRGSFGWEIKLVGDDEKDILKRLDKVNKEMIESYNNLNTTKEEN